ncbi:tripartite tricarboxylate transporter TctB family protein [Chelatococcus sp. YT9]|uniref:tripartite tricarboxylate transporter TctB family protein n=1 Tax=Chelatococcus sp. YT9 TaxID=2835635 RepID=UPI001BCF6CD2|nr:tripartite tricarboxylate transporter TctB family protein [Chelatococcus sp. YT9]MBS7701265.1 tripartite tricarboxylate transporter TctB family protein [Chelatococcus sp. YT9]
MPITKDGIGGILFIAIGLTALMIARHYPTGSALSMGPGFVPMIVSSLLLGLGVLLFCRSILQRNETQERVTIAWRPLLLVTGAIVGFALLIQFGLVVAVTYLVIAAWIADPNRSSRALPILIVVGIGMTVLIFKIGLQLPISL